MELTHNEFLVELVQLATKGVESRVIRSRSGSQSSLLESSLRGGQLISKGLELVGVGLNIRSSFREVLLVSCSDSEKKTSVKRNAKKKQDDSPPRSSFKLETSFEESASREVWIVS